MKKKMFIALAAFLVFAGARAQQDSAMAARVDSLSQVVNRLQADSERRDYDARQERIWKRKKGLVIGWVNQTLSAPDGEVINPDGTSRWKSNVGVNLRLFDRTWYVHKAIAGMVRFGIDFAVDMNYAQYKKSKGVKLSMGDDDGFDDGFGDDFDNFDEPSLDFDLGMHQLDGGLSVGPSVTVVPFYWLDNRHLDDIKVSLYYHFLPSYSGIIRSGDDDTEVASAFNLFGTVGGKISWKFLTLGVEHRQGSAKYDSFGLGLGEGDGESAVPDGKIKYKTKSTRFYLKFSF